MTRINFCIIPAILIILLSVFFFLSPKFFAQKAANNTTALNDLITQKYLSVGNSIAHFPFVVDYVLENDIGRLTEIIAQLRKDEPEITFIHITDDKNKIIASTDPNSIDKIYNSNILASGTSVVKEKSGIYEGGFSINVGSARKGMLFFQVKPKVPEIKVSSSSNPIVLIVGIVFALITFFIILSVSRGMETKLVEQINKRQEEVFLPKIESLKTDQTTAQKKLDELNKKINDGQQNLKKLNDDYLAKKKEIETNPVFQSVDKLKATEAELLKRLEVLKTEESKLNDGMSLLKRQKEEVHNALEAEKKEESVLREKLDLIKKKILHLETPAK